MKEVLPVLMQTLGSGSPAVLAVILESRGSAPRGAGACMLVGLEGRLAGTVGGGRMERAAELDALAQFKLGTPLVRTYRLDNASAAGLGMVCGGEARVLLAPLPVEQLHIFQTLTETAAKGPAGLRLDICGESVRLTVVDKDVPARPVLRETKERLTFLLPAGLGERALIFGGGHVARALAPQLHAIGFRVTVYDDRPEFADPALFAGAERVICAPFARAGQELAVTPEDYVIVMTRGHEADYEVLRQMLNTGARYIGCIGSRHKRAYTRQRLLGEGFTQADFERVYTPIGLNIGAETPAEIAVSIAAELIASRRGMEREEWTWK